MILFIECIYIIKKNSMGFNSDFSIIVMKLLKLIDNSMFRDSDYYSALF